MAASSHPEQNLQGEISCERETSQTLVGDLPSFAITVKMKVRRLAESSHVRRLSELPSASVACQLAKAPCSRKHSEFGVSLCSLCADPI